MRGLALLVVLAAIAACSSSDETGTDVALATASRGHDLDPTCGGPGQARCADGSCDDGTRFLNSSAQQCVACGSNGLTYCYVDPRNVDPGGGKKCNAETRFDNSVLYACIACGHDGETYCYQDPSNFTASLGVKCGAGTRYDGSRFLCIACGGVFETYCYADPNGMNPALGKTCDTGFVYDPASNLCLRR